MLGLFSLFLPLYQIKLLDYPIIVKQTKISLVQFRVIKLRQNLKHIIVKIRILFPILLIVKTLIIIIIVNISIIPAIHQLIIYIIHILIIILLLQNHILYLTMPVT